MKKSIILFAGLCLLASCHESMDERAAREAKEYTEKFCPSPIQSNTRTDSLTFDEDTRTLGYWYTLCGNADNAEGIEKNKDKLRSTLLDGLRSSTDMKAYKDAEFNFRYVYHSEKNPQQILFDVTFSKKDY